MTIQTIIPRLLTGTSEGLSRTLEMVARWDEETAKREIGEIPKRYEKITGEQLTAYTGLVICSEASNALRTISTTPYEFAHALRELSTLALYYHNLQFEKNDSNTNSELPKEGGDLEGSKD